jgi:hypothetical protein
LDHFASLIMKRARGQLFVLAALALAVLVIGVALLLNSGVYSANLAAQNADGGVEEPREFLREAEIGANRVMEYSNYNNFSSYANLRRNFAVGVHNWSERAHDHRARSGEGVEIREVNVTNGSRITQDTDKRRFRNNTLSQNWTLADSLGGVRQFRMNITTDSLPNTSLSPTRSQYQSSSYFRIGVTPVGGPTKRIYIYGNNTQEAALLRVGGGPSGLSPPCKVAANADDRATIYISDGLVGHEHCEALDFLDDPATPFAINYTNGNNIEGSYELFVDATEGNVQGSDYGTDSNNDPPVVEEAIYTATVGFNYTAEDASLSGNRTASPDRRRFISGGRSFTFSIPTGDNVTFLETGSSLKTLNNQGSSSTYSVGGNPKAIGPTAVNVSGGSELDTPYINSPMSANLRVNSGSILASDPLSSDGTVGVGSWNGGGPSVFYASDSNAIRQANQTGGAEEVLPPATGATAVAGIANVTPDDSDIVYVNGSDVLYYDNGSSSKMVDGSQLGATSAPSVGTPADFDGDGFARVPFVNTGDQLLLADKDGTTTPVSTGPDTPLEAPMATLDWNEDGELDIIFINNSDYLKIVSDVTGTETVSTVNDSSGDPVQVGKETLGVR